MLSPEGGLSQEQDSRSPSPRAWRPGTYEPRTATFHGPTLGWRSACGERQRTVGPMHSHVGLSPLTLCIFRGFSPMQAGAGGPTCQKQSRMVPTISVNGNLSVAYTQGPASGYPFGPARHRGGWLRELGIKIPDYLPAVISEWFRFSKVPKLVFVVPKGGWVATQLLSPLTAVLELQSGQVDICHTKRPCSSSSRSQRFNGILQVT